MTILLPRTTAEESKVIARRLKDRIHAITLPDKYASHPAHLSVSQGISSFPMDGDSVEKLLERADQALYVVKQNGRGDYALYRDVADKVPHIPIAKKK